MRSLWVAGLLLWFAALCHTQDSSVPTRVIRICVVDDGEDPVPRLVMTRALAAVEQTYVELFGVKIESTYRGHSSYDPDKRQQPEKLKDRCGLRQDLGVVFSSKTGSLVAPRLHRMGVAYPDAGYFMIYTGPVCIHQLGLQEKINAAFEHEFAHMWGASTKTDRDP